MKWGIGIYIKWKFYFFSISLVFFHIGSRNKIKQKKPKSVNQFMCIRCVASMVGLQNKWIAWQEYLKNSSLDVQKRKRIIWIIKQQTKQKQKKTTVTVVVQSLSSSSFVDKVELIIRFHWLIDWHIIRRGKNQRSSSPSSTFSSKLILKNISNAFIHRWYIMIAINFFFYFSRFTIFHFLYLFQPEHTY